MATEPCADDPWPEDLEYHGGAEESRKKFETWFEGQHSEHAAFPVKGMPPHVGKLVQRLDPSVRTGGVHLMSQLVAVRYRFPFPETNPCAAIEMGFLDGPDPPRANIALLFWRDGPEPTYACVGPVLDSRDGEYRGFLTKTEGLLKNYGDTSFERDKSAIEARVLELIASGELELNVRIFGALPEKRAASLENSRVVTMSAVAYVVQLFVTFMVPPKEVPLDAGEEMYHFGPAHAKLAAATRKKFAAGMRPFKDRVSDGADWMGWVEFTRGRTGTERGDCGIKLIPLTERELASPDDVSLPTWREYWALEAGSDLMINFIAPGFPHIVSTGLVPGATAALYDNPAMHERLGRGGAARESLASLRRAREMARGEAGRRKKTDPRGAELFENLDARVYHAADYVASFLAPTDYALLIAQEFEGYTLYDLATSRLPAIAGHLGLERAAKIFGYLHEPALLDKIIFDWAWTLHAGHTRAGIVQGDVHANNITARKYTSYPPDKALADDGPICVYVDDVYSDGATSRGAAAAAWAVPHPGAGGYLLDFSRVILGGAALKGLDAEFWEGRGDVFRRDQAPRMFAALKRWAPTIVERDEARFRGLVMAETDAVFAALTGADYASLGSTLVALADHAEKHAKATGIPLVIATEHLRKRGQVFARAGRSHLNHALAVLLKGSGGAGRGAAPAADVFTGHEHAGTKILGEVFADWRVLPEKRRGGATRGGAGGGPARDGWGPAALAKKRVGDVWRMGNPLRYSGKVYERFPPWAQIEKFVPHLGGLKMAEIIADGPLPPGAFADSRPELAAVADQARADLEPAPYAASDAWLHSA